MKQCATDSPRAVVPEDDPSTKAARWLQAARSIVVLTGAGMSAESGIPTFRDEQNGLWSKFSPEDLATPEACRQDKARVWAWYVWRMTVARAANPHAGHAALAKLGEVRPGLTVITQNVDDLHERAGSRKVVHLHGSLFAPRCFACARPFEGFQVPGTVTDLRLQPPRCKHCGGYGRPGVVWFGESLPLESWKAAQKCAEACDLMIVVGTSAPWDRRPSCLPWRKRGARGWWRSTRSRVVCPISLIMPGGPAPPSGCQSSWKNLK